jgi:hypothetical protein
LRYKREARLFVFCVVIVFFCFNIPALEVNLLEVRERYKQGYYVFCVVVVFACGNILKLNIILPQKNEKEEEGE